MARNLELTDDSLVITYDGLSSALTLMRELRVPYGAISEVKIGLDELPGPFAWRVGLSTAPFGETRRGRFRRDGRRLFLDVADPSSAVVLELSGGAFDSIALDVPEGFADELRERVGSAQSAR
jgi:hypothetical protein